MGITKEEIEEIHKKVAHLGDWFTYEKCQEIGQHIVNEKPTLCVEIGVFRGQSAIATGLFLQKVNKGMLYAIDPWSVDATQEGTNDTANNEWWASLDMEAIKKEFEHNIEAFGLRSFITSVQNKSEDVASEFTDKIDLLHIDGNHSEEKSCLDVELWVPKLNKGGMLIMDDINWRTTQKAQELIERYATKTYQTDTFAVYVK